MCCRSLSILYYGSEAWTVNKRIEKQLEATEMWFWRRMLKVPWTDKITNEDILKQVNEKRKTIKELETIKIHRTPFKKRKLRKYTNNRQNNW
jgi:hypothetical protein